MPIGMNNEHNLKESEIDLSAIVKFVISYSKYLIIFAIAGGIVGVGLVKIFPNYSASAKIHVQENTSPINGLALLSKGPKQPAAFLLLNRLRSYTFALYTAEKMMKTSELTTVFNDFFQMEYQKYIKNISKKEDASKERSKYFTKEWLAEYLIDKTGLSNTDEYYISIKNVTPFEELSLFMANFIALSAVSYLQELQKSESKQSRSYIQNKITEINRQRDELSKKLRALRTHSEFFGGSVSESGFFGLGIEDIKSRLHETHLNINENKRHIALLESLQAKRALTLSESTILENLIAENEILQIKAKSLNDYLNQNNSKKNSYASTLSGFQLLSRELDLLVGLYTELNKQQVTLELDYLSLADRISLFETSRLKTVQPIISPIIAMIAGILVFIFIGSLISIIHSSLYPSIASLKDLKIFDIGQLGTLPKLSASSDKVLIGSSAKGFPEQFDTNVGLRAFKNLRRSLLNVLDVKKYKKIVVSSPHAANGKSTIVINLALGLASIGKKVLVIDSDVVNPAASRRFGLSGKRGLTDLISGMTNEMRDCIHSLDIPQRSTKDIRLDVLPIGRKPKQSIELTSSKSYPEIVEKAAENYDIVLVDTPPIMASTDGNDSIKMADMVILSIMHGKTKVTDMMATLQNMPPRKHEATYAVLNFVPRWSSEETSSYYYSYLETNTKRKKKNPSRWKEAA